MIKTFTIEHFKRLEPYEVHLNRALNGRYVYALTRPIFNELSVVYKDLGYTQRLTYDCSSCLLNLCITLGNYYFPFKKQMEAEQKNEGYGIKDEGTSYPVSPAQFDGEPNDDFIKEPQEENEEENPDFTEEDLEKAAVEINEAIIKDIVESHKELVTTTKTNNTKTKKTNTRKKK